MLALLARLARHQLLLAPQVRLARLVPQALLVLHLLSLVPLGRLVRRVTLV